MATPENKQKTADTTQRIGRFVKALGRAGVTLLVAAAALLAVQFGASELDRRAAAAPLPDAAATISVSTSPVIQETGYTIKRVFVGQIEAQKATTLSFELSGRLDEIFADEGDHVETGQLLAQQDISLLKSESAQLKASKEATQAQLRFADQTVTRSRELTEQGFTSQAGLDEALARQRELRARIAEIDAGLENVEIRIAKAQLRAPFDGQITTRLADGGETLSPGQQIFGLVELSKPQARIGVPLDINAKDLEDAAIEVGGVTYAARLQTLRPDIDPVTRTRTALFELDGSNMPAFGQTVRLTVDERIEATGLWVPTTSLKEGVRGQWTVLTVDQDSVVRAASVEILHAQSERVFVRGAFPDGTQLVDAGPQRVTAGQRVVAIQTE